MSYLSTHWKFEQYPIKTRFLMWNEKSEKNLNGWNEHQGYWFSLSKQHNPMNKRICSGIDVNYNRSNEGEWHKAVYSWIVRGNKIIVGTIIYGNDVDNILNDVGNVVYDLLNSRKEIQQFKNIRNLENVSRDKILLVPRRISLVGYQKLVDRGVLNMRNGFQIDAIYIKFPNAMFNVME